MTFNISTAAKLRGQRTRRRHGNILSIELVMVVPILLVIVLAFVEFGILLMASQGVGAAASNGAREAALPSATKMSIQSAVDSALSGWVWRGKHEVLVFVNNVKDVDGSQMAASSTGDTVSVTVKVDMAQAAPDLLRYFGISIANKDLRTTYVTRKE